MDNLKIPLDGKDIRVKLQELDINQLELDELNPRISFFKDNQVEDVLNEEQIIFALTNKKPEAYRKLKDSIHNNRGIIYPIWIKPIEHEKYKVIEGNTRVVVYQQLAKDEPKETKWKTILSYILPNDIDEGQKNFIRLQSHLRGTTEWDAYEKAKYLYKLWQEDSWSKQRLEKQTKMTEKQISDNIDAYRLMEQQYLPKHGDDPNEVSKFSYFVEYVKDKKLQKLMEKNSKSVSNFCDWVADKNKLPTGQDVRKLRDLLENKEIATTYFENGFDSAMQILTIKKPNLVSGLYKEIESVIEGLKDISMYELDEIISEKKGERERIIRELLNTCKNVVKHLDSK
jgi:hypothetical protein